MKLWNEYIEKNRNQVKTTTTLKYLSQRQSTKNHFKKIYFEWTSFVAICGIVLTIVKGE